MSRQGECEVPAGPGGFHFNPGFWSLCYQRICFFFFFSGSLVVSLLSQLLSIWVMKLLAPKAKPKMHETLSFLNKWTQKSQGLLLEDSKWPPSSPAIPERSYCEGTCCFRWLQPLHTNSLLRHQYPKKMMPSLTMVISAMSSVSMGFLLNLPPFSAH